MRWLLLVLQLALAVLPVAAQGVPPAPVGQAAQRATTPFARLIEQLSEGGGYFQSDNLVSNETSYLHAIDAFRALGLKGGAYLGVGPEQSFSYIAALEPEIAFLIDIRRDNLLLHLLLKAMFERARNRMEYLCLLFSRPAPPDLAEWTDLPLEDLLLWLDGTRADSARHAGNHADLMKRVERYGVPLDPEDRATLRRFHDEFAEYGLDLRYTTRGGRPRPNYPTIRELYLERDLEGNEASYVSTEDRWRVLRDLHRRERIVPVVGDLSGPKAVKAIGAYLRVRGIQVSAFYLSNVESYLFRQGAFRGFVENVRALPSHASSVLVRSYFGRGFQLPNYVPGHFSTQLVQTFPRFLALTVAPDLVDYWVLISDSANVRPAAARP